MNAALHAQQQQKLRENKINKTVDGNELVYVSGHLPTLRADLMECYTRVD